MWTIAQEVRALLAGPSWRATPDQASIRGATPDRIDVRRGDQPYERVVAEVPAPAREHAIPARDEQAPPPPLAP